MKHIVQAFLLVLAFTLFCPLTAFASQIYTEGYFKYTVEDDSVSICEYYGKESEVTVPSTIVGNPVSTIAKGAFSDNTNVKKVNLPDTIMTIEEGAFASGINVVYDSNTDNPIESGANKPSDSDEPGNSSDNTNNPSNTNNPGNTENPDNAGNSDNTAVGGNEVGIEEIEVDLDEDNTISGISIPNTGKIITVNDKKQLVSVDADGTETVLDDIQEYTLIANEDGTVTITDADGREVTIDEDGNPVIPSAVDEDSDSQISVKMISVIIVAIVIIVIAVIAICFRKRKQTK